MAEQHNICCRPVGSMRFLAFLSLAFSGAQIILRTQLSAGQQFHIFDERVPFSKPLLQALHVAGLHVGCGEKLEPPPWLNIDIQVLVHVSAGGVTTNVSKEGHITRLPEGQLFLQYDASKGLPFDAGSVGNIFSEHFVEHITQLQLLTFFDSARQVLQKQGGLMRISTPSLLRYIEGYLHNKRSKAAGDFFVEHASRIFPEALACSSMASKDMQDECKSCGRDEACKTKGRTIMPEIKQRGAFMVNQIFNWFGHEFIYDYEELELLLTEAGFGAKGIKEVAYKQGAMGDLDSEYHNDETLYLEVTTVQVEQCTQEVRHKLVMGSKEGTAGAATNYVARRGPVYPVAAN
jgi:predicted SAM-dependent methyltransferase